MGKNKLAKFAEMAHFSNVIQVTFNELLQKEFPYKGKWSPLWFGNNAPVVVEMGCGKGEYTVGMAEKFPHVNFIGVDVKGSRMYTGAKYALDHNLRNAVFVRSRIENSESLFGCSEISEIWLTFPDPQMKQVKKRLTSSFFLRRYRNFLQEEGILHLKTDSWFLYSYTSALVLINNFRVVAQTADLHNSGITGQVPDIRTYYEDLWIAQGIPIKYVSFLPGGKGEIEEPAGEFERDSYRSRGHNRMGGVKNGGFFQQSI